jgi:ubiquinone/menaquinone biosynthesis C-methylase UbiE
VVVSCSLGVECYDQQWSPVIPAAAVGLSSHMDLAQDAVVLDVGAGTGALAPATRHAVPYCSLLCLDASKEMLGVAHRCGPNPTWRRI